MARNSMLALLLCLFGLGTLSLAGCGDGATTTADAACTCESAKTTAAGWCDACEVGYVQGKKTDCARCVTAARDGTPCPDCAMAAGKCPVSAAAGDAGAPSPLADPLAAGAADCPVKADGACKGECKGDCKSKEECKGDCKDCEACAGKKAGAGKPACVCEKGKAGEPVWCDACEKGYVDGKPAGCEGCVKKAVKAREESKTDG